MRPKLKLNPTAIERLPFATAGQQLHLFDKPPGLMLLVGKRTKTFCFQSDRGGKSKRVTFGRWPETDVDAARARALEQLTNFARGIGLLPQTKITLRQATDAYLRDRKKLAPRTREYTEKLFDRYLSDWYKKPLTQITGGMVNERHAEISKAHPPTANDVMRKLRVVYNHATATDNTLPANPVRTLSALGAWNPSTVKQDHVPVDKIADWMWAMVDLRAVNPVHADLVALILLTGMRRNEASALRWEEVDMDAGTITLTAERTKQRRVHVVFLSAQALDILKLRGPSKDGWVFPANSASGHVAEPRWALERINEEAGIVCSVHGLRRTFVSIAETCAISPMQLSALVGHAASGITQRYVIHEARMLRDAAAIVGNRIEALWLDE